VFGVVDGRMARRGIFMTTEKIVERLRDMAAQCIDAPKSKAFFEEAANRLEMTDQLEHDSQVSFNEAMDEKDLLTKRAADGWKLCAVLQMADCMTKHYFVRTVKP
jgi:hypothetical protein